MFSGDRAQLCTGRGQRQKQQAAAAERAAAYCTWLVEEETVAEWRQHAEEVPVTQLLDDGKTLTVFRWSRRQIVAEKVLAAQQRLAFAQGALNERLGGESSPLWEFGWDGCHEMFEEHAKVIRQVFLKFEWDIAVVADPHLRMEVTRRATAQGSGDGAGAGAGGDNVPEAEVDPVALRPCRTAERWVESVPETENSFPQPLHVPRGRALDEGRQRHCDVM